MVIEWLNFCLINGHLQRPAVDATNEDKHDNVKVRHQEFVIKTNNGGQVLTPLNQNLSPGSVFSFTYTFEPHSLTAIELKKAA